MKYILKYQNPFKPIVRAGQFLPNEGKPWGTVMPKTKPKETPKETTNEKVANVLSDLGTRTLSAVGSFGGSVIGDAINDFISPKAAENVEKYTLGIIPHTRPEQYAANRQQGNWNSRLDQASEASAMNLTGQGVTALMQKFGPVIAKKIVDLPANETERVIKKLSNPKLLKKLETQSNMRTAEFPKLDIRGKLIQDRFIKKSDAAIAEKDLASENFWKGSRDGTIDLKKYPKGELSPHQSYMKPYHDKINQIENTYNQKIANKIGLPIQADTPLGSGAFGTVFPVKGKSNLVVKLGRPLEFETPETMYHLQQVGKELKDPNIALPIKTTFFEGQRGTNMSQIMPFVEGKPVRNPINVPQSSMDDLVSKIKNLHDKGVLVDFVNPDNILFDAAKNKFSIVDLNTQAPEYHFFNQVNKPKIGWEATLKERYQWQPETPVPKRATIPSPAYSFGERSLGPPGFKSNKAWDKPMKDWFITSHK